ncbi:MAG: hypothetical protein ACFB21_13490 [Opitutales bacterium]
MTATHASGEPRYAAAVDLILATLRDLNDEWQLESLEEPTEETRLFGAKSGLDSLMLVTLIAELEERAREQFGADVILADESAMSATRSPFRRVGTLAEHLCTQLPDDGA